MPTFFSVLALEVRGSYLRQLICTQVLDTNFKKKNYFRDYRLSF